LIPLTDAAIYAHLAGNHTIGVYPLLEDDSCHFVAIDFDETEWKDDVRAFAGYRAMGYSIRAEGGLKEPSKPNAHLVGHF